MKRTGPMNDEMKQLILELKIAASKTNCPLWKRLAFDLERPTRERRIVNLSRINRVTENDETIVVPGKVLGSGDLDHKVHVAAFSFSTSAADAIKGKAGTVMNIKQLIQKDPKGKKIRIIG